MTKAEAKVLYDAWQLCVINGREFNNLFPGNDSLDKKWTKNPSKYLKKIIEYCNSVKCADCVYAVNKEICSCDFREKADEILNPYIERVI